MFSISKKQARRFILMKQGLYGSYRFFGKTGIIEYIRQAGCIQFDPIDICGKNHELVLQSRVEGFSKSQLFDLLYSDRALIDHFDKNMAITSMDDWPYLDSFRDYYRNNGRGKDKIDGVSGDIFQFIDENGPSCSADIQLNERINWYWAPTSLARAALDTLYYRGDLVVHHKKNTRKYYDLADNCVPGDLLNAPNPNVTEEDKQDWHVLRRINSVGMLWNRSSDAWLGIRGLKTPQRNASFQRLLSSGAICEVIVEDIKLPLYIATDDTALMNEAIQTTGKSQRTEFIAPLDNVIWDRRLIDALFGFSYKWEIYTPVKERKYGYYVLPLLYGEQFAGRVEIKKNTESGKYEIINLWLEDKVRETKKLHHSIDRSLKKFNRFHMA